MSAERSFLPAAPRLRYPFRAAWKRNLTAAFDAVGWLFLARPKRRFPKNTTRILVVRLDQIGDIAFADPFLRAVKEKWPMVEIVFLTTPAGAELYRAFASDYHIEVFESDWFESLASLQKSIRDWFRLKAVIRRIAPDVVFALRGDVRHITAARAACPDAWLASFSSTGGGFWLDWTGSDGERLHAAARNFELLRGAGAEPPRACPVLSERLGGAPLAGSIEALLPAKDRPWIALHASAGAPAKLWPVAHWKSMLSTLVKKQNLSFFWIGDEAAGDRAREIQSFLGVGESSFMNLCGRVPLSQLGSFLKRCDLLVTHDSAPAHIGSAANVKTLVFFSGTNDLFQWKPLGANALTLYHAVPCSPCHARECPLGHHDCMQKIDPASAAESLLKFLSEKPR